MIKSLFYQESRRLLFIMRVTVINILVSAILITISHAEEVNGQGVLDRRVTLALKGEVMIKDVLSEIESKAEVKFTYRPKVVRAKKKISIEVFNATIRQVLDEMFESEIAYEAIGEQIVLTPIEEELYDGSLRGPDVMLFEVSGKIIDETGSPLPGVNIIEKGTSNGTTTDATGSYVINVTDENATLVLSFIGYQTQEIQVGGRSTIDFQMIYEAQALEEIIVTGYGEQKKSVVTGAISRVTSANLEKVPNGPVFSALQGRVAGVTVVQNSGQPGSTSTVRIRGVTSLNAGNSPLWVVDGFVIPDAGGMKYLNQADIQSIEVLKDATSQAIYGTRAAAGVILVTTKQGQAGKMNVTYEAFVGTSQPARKLDLLNATEYAMIMNERSLGGGGPIIYDDPSSFGKGTDWQATIFNNSAKRSNHQINLSGGNDRSNYYFSFGYQNTEGIVATDISGYKKYTARLNSSHKLSTVFTISQTLGYAHEESKGLGNTNSEYGGPLASAINLDPITPIYETDPVKLANPSLYPELAVRNSKGQVYGISTSGMQEMSNPLAYIQTRLGRKGWADNIVGNVALEANIIEGLRFKSIASSKLAFWGDMGFMPAHYLGSGGGLSQPINNLSKNLGHKWDWNIENFITYTKAMQQHNLTVMLGQGAYVENIGGGTGYSLSNLPVNNYKDASFGYATASSVYTAYAYSSDGNLTGNKHKLTSIFGRVNYDFGERYLFTGILRRDGSNRFGANNRFGFFPGASAGWNVDRESFWPQNDIVNTFKVRGGFGVTGSDALAEYKYLSLVNVGYNYTIGNEVIDGYAPVTLENPDLKWEQTTQINVGFEATLLNYFDVTVDYYKKKTSDILRQLPIPGYVGVSELPWANIADMENTGIELELKYSRDFGPLRFNGSANFSTLKNTITHITTAVTKLDGEASFQNLGPVTARQVGESYNAFYGYQTAGIFQNQAEIDAYKNGDGDLIQPNAEPGDFKWVDINGDGKITIDDQDKTLLGTSLPKYTFGFTLNFEYKGFDMMIFANGAGGNKIFRGLRRLDIGAANYTSDVLNRWTGEGTSNSYPRLSSSDPNGNFSKMSDFWLEDGDFMRFKIVQVGYTIPENAVLGKLGINRFRVYVTGENLLTFTKYSGYDPEIGGDVFAIDKGQYPQARSFLFGLQIQL